MRPARCAAVIVALVVVGGCSGAPRSSSGTPVARRPAAVVPTGASWPTYHGTDDRAGYAASFPEPHRLARAWSADLDGAVYGQPVVVGRTVYAATENDTVYALDLASGRVAWRRHVGTPVARRDLPCGDIDPLGITGTPAYDRATRTLFVAAETTGARHTLTALDARDGRVRFTRGLDAVPGRDPAAEQQRGALLVANGRVYVPFGGLFGDCGDYVGYLTATRTDGRGGTRAYAVPTAREGGIWAPSGPAAAGGSVYVAVGNGASTGGPFDGGDSVLRLTPDLHRRAYFAPAGWGTENAGDADLGATGPLPLPGGGVLIAGKDGDVYLLGAGLGGVGGQRASVPGCTAFGGMARAGTSVFVPCTQGVQRLDVSGGHLRRVWTASSSITGSPVATPGAVWALDTGAGDLHALSPATGATIASRHVAPVSRFASPTPAAPYLLVPTLHGVIAVRAGRP